MPRPFHLMLALVPLLAGIGCAEPSVERRVLVDDVQTQTDALLIGVSSAGSEVVWVAGTGGTFGRSVDSGRTWTFGTVAGADSLQFRDVHAVDSTTAYLLSIGPGSQSRIYRTQDGGRNWDLQWTNSEPDGFFDCFDFWSPEAGLAMGDAVNGRIMMIHTVDGNRWSPIDSTAIPAGTEGEGGFAASGTCVVAAGDSTAFIGTGSTGGSKVYRSTDRGSRWDVVDAPIISGVEASGIMSLAFTDERLGYAAGGALSMPDEPGDNFAATLDGGRTWASRGRPQLPAVYGLAASPGRDQPILLAVGPKGMDVSFDSGFEWTSVDKRNYWGVHFVDPSTAIVVGPAGRLARVTVGPLP